MDGCKGRQERATKRKERPKFRVATADGGGLLGSDSTRDYTGVERSFPLYAPGSIHSITLPAGYGHSLYGVPMGSIHCITLPAGYGHSLYGVPMGPIHCITLTAMCSTHVPLLIWSANGSNVIDGYVLYHMCHSLYGVPMGSIHCITLTAGYALYTCTTPYMECQWILYIVRVGVSSIIMTI